MICRVGWHQQEAGRWARVGKGKVAAILLAVGTRRAEAPPRLPTLPPLLRQTSRQQPYLPQVALPGSVPPPHHHHTLQAASSRAGQQVLYSRSQGRLSIGGRAPGCEQQRQPAARESGAAAQNQRELQCLPFCSSPPKHFHCLPSDLKHKPARPTLSGNDEKHAPEALHVPHCSVVQRPLLPPTQRMSTQCFQSLPQQPPVVVDGCCPAVLLDLPAGCSPAAPAVPGLGSRIACPQFHRPLQLARSRPLVVHVDAPGAPGTQPATVSKGGSSCPQPALRLSMAPDR